MENLWLDIYTFTIGLIPIKKRQPNRKNLFYWCTKRLETNWTWFVQFRKDSNFKVGAIASKIILEEYLNRFVTGSNNQIEILDTSYSGGADYLEIGLNEAEGTLVEIPRSEGEALSTGVDLPEIPLNASEVISSYDFIVLHPSGANTNEITEILTNFIPYGVIYNLEEI